MWCNYHNVESHFDENKSFGFNCFENILQSNRTLFLILSLTVMLNFWYLSTLKITTFKNILLNRSFAIKTFVNLILNLSFQVFKLETRHTIQKNSVGFSLWENTEIPWDMSVLFFRAPPLINNGIFLPILFRKKICFTLCFMVNEALVAPPPSVWLGHYQSYRLQAVI